MIYFKEMVKIADLAKQKAVTKENLQKKINLLEKIFNPTDSKLFSIVNSRELFITVFVATKKIAAYNNCVPKQIEVYSLDYLKNAIDFGEAYEKEFKIKKFVVKTDYSD